MNTILDSPQSSSSEIEENQTSPVLLNSKRKPGRPRQTDEERQAKYEAHKKAVAESIKKKWVESHEEMLEIRRKYYQTHKEQIQEYNRRYRQKHREYVKELEHKIANPSS